MPKLIVKDASVDYHGFFARPAFSLMGEGAKIMSGLFDVFSSHDIGLSSFRTETDISEPSANGVAVSLGRFGVYRFKFDQVHAHLRGFDDDDLAGMVTIIQKGDEWLRASVEDFSFRNHVFIYASHSALSEGTSQGFLQSIPRRPVPMVFGKDLGSGIIETWYESDLDAKIHFTMSHSLVEAEGIYIHYMVAFDRSDVDYVQNALKARTLLDRILESLHLEFDDLEAEG